MNWVRHGNSATFETKSSYRRVARQSLPCSTTWFQTWSYCRANKVELNSINLFRHGSSTTFESGLPSELHSPVADPEEGPGGGGAVPPLFLDQAEARRAEKIFFGEWAFRYLRVGWRPRPPLLISRSGSSTALFILFLRNVGKRQTSVLTELLQIRWEVVVSMERSCTILATQLCMLILIK